MIPKALQNIPHLAFAFSRPRLPQYYGARQISSTALAAQVSHGGAKRNKAVQHYYTWGGHDTEEASPARPLFIKVIIRR